MAFEWDHDPYAVSMPDESEPSEERFVGIGVGALGRILVVVYTHRGDNIRIISARVAAAHERREYDGD